MEGTHGASTSHGSDAKTSPPENAEGQIVGGPKSSDEVPSDMPKFVPKFRKRQVSVYVTAHQTDKVWLNGAPAVVEDDRNVDGKVQVKIRLKSTKETVWVPEERLKVAKSVREQVLHDWGFPHVVENVAEPLAERMIKLTPPEGWPLGLQGTMELMVTLIYEYWAPRQPDPSKQIGMLLDNRAWFKTQLVQEKHDKDKIRAIYKHRWLRRYGGDGTRPSCRFVDKSFLPTDENIASITKRSEMKENLQAFPHVVWRRPEQFPKGLSRVNERGEQIQEENKSGDNFLPWTLVRGERGGISPDDIYQGRIGDCWFLSSLSVLASKPQQVRNLLLSSNDDMKTGQFLVRIAETGKWKTLVVDDLFPVDPQAGVLAFCGSTSNELWVSVIEKAYAKAHGGYKNIEGGMASWALHELTGCPVKQLRLDQLSFGEAWERLQACKKDECLMCVSTKFLQDKDNGLYKAVGLVEGHAYSVLDVLAVKDTSGNMCHLVKLRNPWGRRAWVGAFSDGSDLLSTLEVDSRENLRVDLDEGIFWMPIEDMKEYFNVLSICSLGRLHSYEARFQFEIHPHFYLFSDKCFQMQQLGRPAKGWFRSWYERLFENVLPISNMGYDRNIADGFLGFTNHWNECVELRFNSYKRHGETNSKKTFHVVLSLTIPLEHVQIDAKNQQNSSYQRTPITHLCLFSIEPRPAGPLIYKFVTSVTSHPLDGGFPACPNVSVTIRCKEHDDGKLYGKILSGKSATTVDPADGEEEEKGPWFPISATERYFLVVCSSLPYRPDLEAEAGAKFDKKYEELFMEHLVSMKAKITKRIHALDSDARLSADSKSVVLTKKQQENHDLIEAYRYLWDKNCLLPWQEVERTAQTYAALLKDRRENVMDDLMLTNELMALESKLAAFNSEYAQALSMEIKKPGLLREYSARGTVSVIVHDAVSLNIRRVHFDGHPALVRLVMSAAQSFQHTMLKRQGLRFGIWYTEAWEMFNRFDFFGEKFWRILCEQSMWILLSQPFHMARIAHSMNSSKGSSMVDTLKAIYHAKGHQPSVLNFFSGVKSRLFMYTVGSVVSAVFHHGGVIALSFCHHPWLHRTAWGLHFVLSTLPTMGFDVPRLIIGHCALVASTQRTLNLLGIRPPGGPDISDNPSSFEILRRICALAQQNGQSLVFTNRVLNSLSYISPLFWGFPTNLMIMGFGTFMDLLGRGAAPESDQEEIPPASYPNHSMGESEDPFDIFYPLRLIMANQHAHLGQVVEGGATIACKLLTGGSWFGLWRGWSFASLAGLTIIPIEYTVIYLWPKLLLSYNRLPPRHRQKIRFFATFATTTTVGMLGVIALGENMFGENRKLRN